MEKNKYVIDGLPRYNEEFMDDAINGINSVELKTKLLPTNGNIKNSATPNLPADVTVVGTVRVHKDTVLNIAHVFGRVQTGGAVPSNKVLANLPVGFRPSYSQHYICDSSSTSPVRLFVEANTGDIRTSVPIQTGTAVSLSGITVDLSE